MVDFIMEFAAAGEWPYVVEMTLRDQTYVGEGFY